METLIKSTLHSEVSGGRVKYTRKPNIWCGDPENGYLPGDLVDANGLADFIALNDIVHDDPAIQELREAIDALGGSSTTYIDGKVEQLQEDDAQIRQLINQTNANFENYYTKQQTYSASEIDTLMNTQRRGQFVITNVLPQASEDTMFKIYLVPSIGPESNNIKDEFVTLQNDNVYSWEQIGSTAVDLSGYSTTAEMNAAIATALLEYATKVEVSAKQDTISDLATIRSGASAGATAYQKPQGGIPDTDLSSAVQTSLGKADTALQQHLDISGKQDKITSSNKLSADLLQDGTTNKVYTSAEKTKLSSIASGAQVNVKPDWNAESLSSSGILNKPEVYTKSEVDNKFLAESVNNNGYTYVDLGLPSGTLWATMNVGANSETDYGNYYMYGKGATQYNSSDTPYTGTEDPLDLSVDTARQVWGGDWHMPTRVQLLELVNNTTYEFTTIDGVNGGKFTAQNGNYIFIPAGGAHLSGVYDAGNAGYIYSSTPHGYDGAYLFYFNSSDKVVNYNERTLGWSVRPVIEPAQTEKYATKTELNTGLNTKQDTLVFNTAYNASTNKAATVADVPTTMGASGTNHKGGLVPDTPSTAGTTKFLCEDGTWQVPSGGQDLSNYVQKNNTVGLLKNDGTVDTNSYMKTVSGTTGNIVTKSSTSGQIQVSSYSPSSLISSAQTGAVNMITGQDGDELPTMTLYSIKSYIDAIDSKVAILTALIGSGAKAGWRDCDGLTGMQGDGTKILCDGDGKVVVIDDGKGNAYWIYLEGTDVKSLQYDEYSSDYTTIDSYGYGEQTYSYTEDTDPNTGNYVKIFTVSGTEYTFDDMLYTISPSVSDWTSGSSSDLVGCPPKWFDLMTSVSQYDGSKILVNSDGQVVMLENYQNSGEYRVVLLDTNDNIVTLDPADNAVKNHIKRYGKATYNDYFDGNYTYKFILNYKEYTIDTQKLTITPSDIEDWPKEKSNADLMWRVGVNDRNAKYLVASNGDVIILSISNQYSLYPSEYTIKKDVNNGQISRASDISQNEGWGSTTIEATETASGMTFEYNGVTYDVSFNNLGSITPDVTEEYA